MEEVSTERITAVLGNVKSILPRLLSSHSQPSALSGIYRGENVFQAFISASFGKSEGIHLAIASQKENILAANKRAMEKKEITPRHKTNLTASLPTENDRTRLLNDDLFLTDDEDTNLKSVGAIVKHSTIRKRRSSVQKKPESTKKHKVDHLNDERNQKRQKILNLIQSAKIQLPFSASHSAISALDEKESLRETSKSQNRKIWNNALHTTTAENREIVSYEEIYDSTSAAEKSEDHLSNPILPKMESFILEPPQPAKPHFELFSTHDGYNLDFHIQRRLNIDDYVHSPPATPPMNQDVSSVLLVPPERPPISAKEMPFVSKAIKSEPSIQHNGKSPSVQKQTISSPSPTMSYVPQEKSTISLSSENSNFEKKGKVLKLEDYRRNHASTSQTSQVSNSASRLPKSKLDGLQSPTKTSSSAIQCTLPPSKVLVNNVTVNEREHLKPAAVALMIRRDSSIQEPISTGLDDVSLPSDFAYNSNSTSPDELVSLLKESNGNPVIMNVPIRPVDLIDVWKRINQAQADYCLEKYSKVDIFLTEEIIDEHIDKLNALFQRGSMAYPRQVVEVVALFLQQALYYEVESDSNSKIKFLTLLAKDLPLCISNIDKLFDDHGSHILQTSAVDPIMAQEEKSKCFVWKTIYGLCMNKVYAVVLHHLGATKLQDTSQAKNRMRRSIQNNSNLKKWDSPSFLSLHDSGPQDRVLIGSSDIAGLHDCNSVTSTPSGNDPMTLDQSCFQSMLDFNEKSNYLVKAQGIWSSVRSLEDCTNDESVQLFLNSVIQKSGVSLNSKSMPISEVVHYLQTFLTLEKSENSFCLADC